MLTPQDIQEKEFSKAVFGGYDMAAVDDFLEELGNDYAALYKDNAVLKGKIKVLVDKVEEYRSTEDSMRLALSSAQKMADDMMAETQAKCDAMIAEAEKAANDRKGTVLTDIAEEEAKLAAAKRETEKFIAETKTLISRFAEALDKAGDEIAKSAPAVEEPVFSPEPERKQKPAAPAQPAPEKPVAEPAPTSASIEDFVKDVMQASTAYDDDVDNTKIFPAVDKAEPAKLDLEDTKIWTDEDEETTPRPKFNFDDLQFGSNIHK